MKVAAVTCHLHFSFETISDPNCQLRLCRQAVAKLLLSLTLEQGSDTNITQNAITPTPFLLETQWSVKVNEGKCSVKPLRLHGPG